MKISCRDSRCKVSCLKIHELERRAHMAVFARCLIFIASFLSEKSVYSPQAIDSVGENWGEETGLNWRYFVARAVQVFKFKLRYLGPHLGTGTHCARARAKRSTDTVNAPGIVIPSRAYQPARVQTMLARQSLDG